MIPIRLYIALGIGAVLLVAFVWYGQESVTKHSTSEAVGEPQLQQEEVLDTAGKKAAQAPAQQPLLAGWRIYTDELFQFQYPSHATVEAVSPNGPYQSRRYAVVVPTQDGQQGEGYMTIAVDDRTLAKIQKDIESTDIVDGESLNSFFNERAVDIHGYIATRAVRGSAIGVEMQTLYVPLEEGKNLYIEYRAYPEEVQQTMEQIISSIRLIPS